MDREEQLLNGFNGIHGWAVWCDVSSLLKTRSVFRSFRAPARGLRSWWQRFGKRGLHHGLMPGLIWVGIPGATTMLAAAVAS